MPGWKIEHSILTNKKTTFFHAADVPNQINTRSWTASQVGIWGLAMDTLVSYFSIPYADTLGAVGFTSHRVRKLKWLELSKPSKSTPMLQFQV
jgi:hypothetical protein